MKREEDEANLFAMFLLIPKQFLIKDLENGIDLADSKALEVLAKKYGVPLNAMAMRIAIFIKRKI